MTIKIEITGESIPEVADKLLAIGRSLYNTAVNDADDVARTKLQDARKGKKPPAKEITPEAPETPVEEPEKTVEEITSAEPEKAPEVAEEPAPGAKALDFEKDVAPLVLRAVRERGKPWVQDLLAQFGAERASQIDDARLGELVALIEEGLGS